jgi:hypothetical protein
MGKKAVAFFGFNRPDCTKVVFEEIRRYHPAQLLLVADGPRPTVPTDKDRCAAVREIMHSVDWDCDVQVNFSDINLGCKKRMASGIDWIFSQVEEVVLLEDDCVPCPDFFRFCSEMLDYYRNEPRVMNIGGTNYQRGRRRGEASYYFSSFPHIWGWASWRRAWQHYDVEMRSWPQAQRENWLAELPLTQPERDYWNSYMNRIYLGKVDTWDCQWLYACWRHMGASIIPNVNLITNIGGGPDATHTKWAVESLAIPQGTLGNITHPKKIEVNRAADKFTFDEKFGDKHWRRGRSRFAWFYRLPYDLKQAVKRCLPFLVRKH